MLETTTIDPVNPFLSFWMAGFECADHLNAYGRRVDLLNVTGHLDLLDTDYQSLGLLNIRTVREGIRWSQVEKQPYVYDWSAVRRIMEVGRSHGIQQVWDICHFGYPADLNPLHPSFARRFSAVCSAFAKVFRSMNPTGPLVVTPINEVSFISWLGGEVPRTSPYRIGQGWEVKYGLMKAYIEGVEALKEADPGVRILTTEPLVHFTHIRGAGPMERAAARVYHEEQFQVTEILAGRLLDIWHQSGIWDRVPEPKGGSVRGLHEPTAQAFLRAQSLVAVELDQLRPSPGYGVAAT